MIKVWFSNIKVFISNTLFRKASIFLLTLDMNHRTIVPLLLISLILTIFILLAKVHIKLHEHGHCKTIKKVYKKLHKENIFCDDLIVSTHILSFLKGYTTSNIFTLFISNPITYKKEIKKIAKSGYKYTLKIYAIILILTLILSTEINYYFISLSCSSL